jgi:hypothetical protein
VEVWRGKQELPLARARVSRTRESTVFTTYSSRAVNAVQSALGMGGCGHEMYVSATCPLQFVKAGSTATLPQQEKNSSEDLQWGCVNIFGFI